MSDPHAPATTGVAFPLDGATRSTSALGRAVLADALDDVDPVGRRAAAAEGTWRSGYLTHFRRVVEAGLGSPEAATGIARAGVESLRARMRWVDPASGAESALADLLPLGEPVRHAVHAVHRVSGRGEPVTELALPYRGRLLTGGALEAQLSAWADGGVLEPGAAHAVRTVAEHPEWLALPGRTVVALGAGAEIGPTPTLLRWGATVAGVDLPRPDLWRRVLQQAEQAAGTLLVPVRAAAEVAAPEAGSGGAGADVSAEVAAAAGVDLLTELPVLAAWLDGLPGPLVLGNYLYADGLTNVRVSAAGDALAGWLHSRRPDLVQAYLATPTDVFAVPAPAVRTSVAAYGSQAHRWTARGLRTLSAGRLLRRAYLPDADPGICDALVAQQGPNYALAKRMQRWRATTERAAGRRVSLNVAPPTRTRSVVKNRALAAAYAGAHRFGVEVFEPSTTRVLMAALLVHDLCADVPVFAEPWQAEAAQAVHGGLWTSPYEPRSALGLAAVLGFGAGRS